MCSFRDTEAIYVTNKGLAVVTVESDQYMEEKQGNFLLHLSFIMSTKLSHTKLGGGMEHGPLQSLKVKGHADHLLLII